MKTFDQDLIYGLLPPNVRTLDAANGSTLYALVGVIASQANLVDDNLYQLYDDLFIETCASWAVSYIGDLIGYRPLRPIPPSTGPARADVADTIGLRRRKGTLVMLDQLGIDVTAWPSVAVEYFALLAVSQYVRNHVRLQNACVDVHGYQTAIDINSAFDAATRSVDVRRIQSGRGRYNVPNIGLFVYRLAPYGGATLGLPPAGKPLVNRLVATTARAVGPGRFTFDPFGDDVALVNPPQTQTEFTLTTKVDVPYPLRRFPLYQELEALRAGTLPPDAAVYFGTQPVLAVFDATGTSIAPAQLAVCDLSTWTAPSNPAILFAVDPELGRITSNATLSSVAGPLRVGYAYAFSGPYGGGSYARAPDPGEGAVTLEVHDFASAAPQTWTSGVVEIGESGIFLGNVTFAPDAAGLVVRAEDDARPVIAGDVTVVAQPGGSFTLRGVGIAGRLRIVPPAIAPSSSSTSSASSSSTGATLQAPTPGFAFNLEHCTVRGSSHWTYAEGGSFTIARSLCGALFVDPTADLSISDSVIDAGLPPRVASGSSVSSVSSGAPSGGYAIAGAGGSRECGNLTLSACTVFGEVATREIILVENCIITGTVSAARTQAGCVRYSYLPPPPYSTVPPRFRCQPDLTIAAALTAAQAADPSLNAVQAAAIGSAITSWLVPVFTSRRKSDGGYAQLADSCPVEIGAGAESEDEMGAFHGLYQPRRQNNLSYRFTEYLRVGLQAGIIHAS